MDMRIVTMAVLIFIGTGLTEVIGEGERQKPVRTSTVLTGVFDALNRPVLHKEGKPVKNE